MIKYLLTGLAFLTGLFALNAQAPAWQWAQDATSNSPESALDVAYGSSPSGAYIAGYFNGNLSAKYGSAFTASYGNNDGFLAKYDALGSVIWAIKIGGANDDQVSGVAVDPSGNVYVNGYFNGTADFDPSAGTFTLSSAGGKDGFLAKYSAAGSLIWATKFGGNGDDYPGRLYADAGNVYITGSYKSIPAVFYSYLSATTHSTTATDSQFNMFGAKYNSSGVVQWVISGGSNQNDNGYNVVADAGNVYFEGNYNSDIVFRNTSGVASPTLSAQQSNKPQVYILSVTQSGAISWQNNITCNSNGNSAEGWGFAQDASNLYVTGDMNGDINFKYPSPTLTQTVSSGFDVFVASLSKTGTFSWRAAASGSGSGDQVGRSVTIDYSGDVIVGGAFINGLNYSSAGGPNYTSNGAHDIFVTAYSNTGSFLWSTTAGGNTRDYVNGITTDNAGSVYVAGEEDGSMIVGTTTLTTGGGHNIFLAKLGCPSISNNTIAASQTICAGATPVALTGSSPSGGNSYLWQSSANSLTWTTAAGTSTTQSYSPGTLTATAFYRRNVYASGSCSVFPNISPVVTITIDQSPSTANAGISQTVCSSSATLNANNPSTGTGQWSLLSGSGNIASPASYSSALTSLGTGTTVLLWTINNGSCPSSTSAVTIVRNAQPAANAGVNQTLCASAATLQASAPSTGTGSWSLLSGSGSIAAVSNPSTGITALGTGTNIFLWTVSVPGCPSATSAVTIVRDAMPSAHAGSNQTICASSATLSAVTPSVGNGAWTLLSGFGNIVSAGSGTSQVTALSTGSNSFLWTVANGSCPSATASVIITRDAQPTANAGSSQTVCAPSATLSAVSPTVGSGAWSVVSGTATVIAPASYSSAVTAFGPGITTLLWTVNNGSCPSSTSAVNIMRDIEPTANAGSSQTICASSATLTAITPTIGSGSWSLLSGSGNILSPGSAGTSVTSLGSGTTSFLWTVANGSCPSATSAVNLVRDVQPTASAGSNQTICASAATLSAVNPTIGSGSWSLLSGSGIITATSSASTPVASLGTGTTVFVWTVNNGSCPSATSAVSIVRDVQPTANAGSNQTVCATSAILNATAPSVGSGAWSQISGSGNISSAINFSSTVTSLSDGINVFVWTVSNGSCPPAASTVSIQRDVAPAANAGSNQTICTSSATLSAVNPSVGTGSWSLLSGTANIGSAGSSSTTINSLGTGFNSFLWTVSNGSCPSATAIVDVIRDAAPVANAGVSQTVCGASCTLSAGTPSTGTGSWSQISGTGAILSASVSATTVSGLSAGNNVFLWTVTNGICPVATSTVSVQSDAMPSASAGSNQTLCAGSATLQAIPPAIGTGSWTLISGSGTIGSANSFSSAVTSLSTGANSFLWTVTNGSCPSATAAVAIVRDAQPTANAGGSQTVCATSATLSAIVPGAGTGAWSLLSGSGNITSAGSNGSQVTALGVGVNNFAWTVSNGSCPPATSTVSVQRDEQPAANAGSNQTVCASSATLNAISPTVGTGQWSLLSGIGAITTPGSYSSEITGLGLGANVFVWTVSNGSCNTATSSVTITRGSALTAQAGSDQTVCASSATLNAIGSGTWSVISGSAIVNSPNNPSSPVTSLSDGDNIFVWTIPNGGCSTTPGTVIITRNAPAAANAGSNQTLCASAATLNAIAPGVGSGSWSLLSGSGDIAAPGSYSSPVNSLGTGANSFLWTVTNGSCPSATSTVTIVRDVQPTANAGSSQSVCASSATLTALVPAAGNGTWSLESGAGALSSVNSNSTAVSSLNPGVNVFIWTVTNGSCPPTNASVTITSYLTPVADAGTSQTVCSNAATLAAIQPSIGGGSWSVISGSAAVSASSGFSSPVSSLGTGTNVFLWTVSNGVCTPATATVAIVRDEAPAANAGSSQTVCASSATLSAITPGVGTGTWSVLSGNATIAFSGSSSSQVNALSPGLNTFLWTVSNGSCPSATAIVSVQSDVQPSANAGSSQALCTSSATLNAMPPAAGSGAWSLLSGQGTIASASSYSTTVTALDNGANSFLWTVSNGSCPSATAMVTLLRAIQPTANAGADQAVCNTTATLAAMSPSAGSGSWSLVSGSGSLTSANAPSSQVTALSTGINVFLWTVTNSPCPAATDTIVIIRDAQPAASAGASQTLCAGSATLNAAPPTAGTGAWSLVSGSGNIVSSSNYSTVINNINTGINTFAWTVSNGSCPPATATVGITRDAQPGASAGANQTVCASSAIVTATAPSVGTGSWSVLSGSGNLISAGSYSSAVTGLGAGLNSFLWTVSNGSCPDATDTVTISRDVFQLANAGSNQTTCASSSTLNANNPAAGTGLWTLLSGSGSFAAAASASTAITGLSDGSNVLMWTINNGSCPSSTATVIIVKDAIPTASAGINQSVCSSSATLNAAIPAIGTGSWSLVSGSGSVTSPGSYSTTVTGLVTGSNVLAWNVTNGVCPAATATVSINRDALPVANAGISQTLCASSATLNAAAPAVGTASWSLLSGSGNIAAANSASSAVTALNNGLNSFLWTVSNGSCPSATAVVSVLSYAQPSANAGSDQTICSASATLNATQPTIGSGAWSLFSGLGTITFSSNFSSAVTSLGTGNNKFIWTVVNGNCLPSVDTVIIIRDAQPSANAGSSQTICASTATFNAVSPAVGTGNWSLISGAGNIISANSPTSQVTNLSVGTSLFLWTVSNGSCPSATSAVTVFQQGQPMADAGADQEVCANSVTLNAVDPAVGTGSWSVISGSAAIAAAGSFSSVLTALSEGTTSLVWTVANGSCPSATDSVNIISDVQPIANAGSNQTLCASSATLNATAPAVGTGAWSVLSGPANVDAVNSSSSSVSSLSIGTNIFLWTVTNGSCPPASASVTVFQALPPVADAGSNQTVCATTTTLNAAAPVNGDGLWTILSGSAIVTATANAASTLSDLSEGNNQLIWTVSNGICPDATDTVLIERDALPTLAAAGTDQQVCGSSATVSANAPVTGTGQWNVIGNNNLQLQDKANPNAILNGLPQGTTSLAWTISNGVCPASADTVIITSYAPPAPADAGPDLSTCAAEITFSVAAPSAGIGTWSVMSGNGTPSENGNAVTVSLPSVGQTTLQWLVVNGVCPVVSDEKIITRTSANVPDGGMDQTVETSMTQLNATLADGTSGKWEVIQGDAVIDNPTDPAATMTHLSFGNNIAKWTVSGGSCPDSSDFITVYVKPLMIPNGFSPNGDGINDHFVISSLDYYNKASLSVFNRWGVLLFKDENYKNDWAGTNMASELLTDDTYYYTLSIEGLKTFTGFVIIKQNK